MGCQPSRLTHASAPPGRLNSCPPPASPHLTCFVPPPAYCRGAPHAGRRHHGHTLPGAGSAAGRAGRRGERPEPWQGGRAWEMTSLAHAAATLHDCDAACLCRARTTPPFPPTLPPLSTHPPPCLQPRNQPRVLGSEAPQQADDAAEAAFRAAAGRMMGDLGTSGDAPFGGEVPTAPDSQASHGRSEHARFLPSRPAIQVLSSVPCVGPLFCGLRPCRAHARALRPPPPLLRRCTGGTKSTAPAAPSTSTVCTLGACTGPVLHVWMFGPASAQAGGGGGGGNGLPAVRCSQLPGFLDACLCAVLRSRGKWTRTPRRCKTRPI